MVLPQIPPQPPIVSGTKTQADIERNAEISTHVREDELAARSRGQDAPAPESLGSRLTAVVNRLLGRSSR